MASAQVTTKQNNLNIRSGPSTSYPVVGKLGKGSKIDIDDRVVSENGWTWVGYNGNWICQKDPRYSYSFVNILPAPKEEVQETKQEPVPEPSPDYSGLVSGLLNQLQGNGNSEYESVEGIDGSAVQYGSDRYSTRELKLNKEYAANKNKGKMSEDELRNLDRKSPEYVQNKLGYPEIKGFNKDRGMYEYNYYMDYSKDNLTSDLKRLEKTLNLHIDDRDQLFRYYTNYYNRFKLANPNDFLSKSFAHVFFVRPDCNILDRAGDEEFTLSPQLQSNANFYYLYKNSPEVLRQLCQDSGYNHDFMMLLSNKAGSFQLSDESLDSDTYGKALTGHRVAYGKHNINSKTAGDFSITYTDDRNFHIYQLHKAWTDYISMVYQGLINPRTYMMENRILDYATCVYYILCAEDGETIIFWSKYYGVFPVSIPSSQNSWAKGNVMSSPDFDIRYQYSWKEDYNPLSLIELNLNSGKKNFTRVPIFNKEEGICATTWVGAPFVETFNNSVLAPYTFKLRFRKGES